MDSLPKLIAIVGPTASGKSDLAMQVAELTPSEIIAADSRTVYKAMDIGTAKPPLADREKVPHWGIDLIEPGQLYSVKQFQDYALAKIDEIRNRQKLVLLTGGTGLYVDSVLYGFNFVDVGAKNREFLESLNLEQLQALTKQKGIALPTNHGNKRHLIRNIEREGKKGTQKQLLSDCLIIGLLPKDEKLKQRIDERVEQMLKEGLLAETKELIKNYGQDAMRLTGGIGYKICMQVLDGEITEQTATTLFKTADWQYARRQKTWFKKNNDIVWFTDKEQALNYLKAILNN